MNQKASREEIIKSVLEHKISVFKERMKRIKSSLLYLKKFLGLASSDEQEESDMKGIIHAARDMLGIAPSVAVPEEAAKHPDSWRGFSKKVYNGPANLDALNEALKPREELQTSSPKLTSAASDQDSRMFGKSFTNLRAASKFAPDS